MKRLVAQKLKKSKANSENFEFAFLIFFRKFQGGEFLKLGKIIKKQVSDNVEVEIDLGSTEAILKAYTIENQFNITRKTPAILKKAKRLRYSETDREIEFSDDYGRGQAVHLVGFDSKELIEKIEDTVSDFLATFE